MQHKKRRRGIHSRPNAGKSIEWLTPPETLRALGRFDLDPCAHPKQFYRTAMRMICPPADGLSENWGGRVWLNPPYGHGVLKLWLARLADHGNGMALVPARTEVEDWFWPYIWERADAVLFVRGRLYFHRPNGTTEGNAGHGSVIVAYGRNNITPLKQSGIEGRFFQLRRKPAGDSHVA